MSRSASRLGLSHARLDAVNSSRRAFGASEAIASQAVEERRRRMGSSSDTQLTNWIGHALSAR
jgi:hypothetical protein